ncbi:hypothetical protein [Enterococcus sp. AZ103]|uniref:hypothetical protein n=1 Tax=Enterococcus sp. AZ103 TaxID=2774628 RepID=UPI003F1F22B1
MKKVWIVCLVFLGFVTIGIIAVNVYSNMVIKAAEEQYDLDEDDDEYEGLGEVVTKSTNAPQTTSSTQKDETDKNSETQIHSASTEQKNTLISFTQLDAEDRNFNLTYEGEDLWNVTLNYIDGKNTWIVTTQDKNYGRVKSIYDWDGSQDSGATLSYLLIDGKELVNNLN